jgi:hypothetical protein
MEQRMNQVKLKYPQQLVAVETTDDAVGKLGTCTRRAMLCAA